MAVAIKIGAIRGMQPSLRGGGDGVTTADMADLQRLLVRYPQVCVEMHRVVLVLVLVLVDVLTGVLHTRSILLTNILAWLPTNSVSPRFPSLIFCVLFCL